MQSSISPPTQTINNHIDKFNFRSKPAQSLLTLFEEQFRIQSLEISSHGRTGVIFVETNKGSFVLKANNEGPIDEFFNRMAGLLDLNIAQTITYCCSDLVFHTIAFQIEKYASRQQSFYSRIKNRLNFPFYQIIEYIPSISLAEVGRDRFENYLIEGNKLYQLGMCIGFDLLTNNSDRFKLLWSSDGNVNNVLIEVRDHDAYQLQKVRDRSNTEIVLGSYVFIDHSGFLLNLKDPIAAKNFEHYMKRVCDFLINMIRSLSQQGQSIPKQFQKLKEQIELYTHYQLTNSDIKRIASGIIYLINKFLKVFQSRAIEELYNSMKKESVTDAKKRKDVQNNYWNQYWNDILGKINLNFLQEVFTKMAAVFDTYPEVINKVIKETEDKIAEHAKKTNFKEMYQNNMGTGQEKQSQLDPSIDPPQDVINSLQNTSPEEKQLHPIPQGTQQNKSQIDKKKEQNNQTNNLNPQKLPRDRKWRQRLAKYVQKTSSSPNHKQN